uniref:Uncharacterized protein n=1 Tax=Rhodosorus marinus TaxID=101924 RepID=A0A7S3A4A6_9RHOD|mmetsp:Transcript_44369/g.172495  ORF Transcript_44369/g.172495 Transcript_44369/m.172495 type:complete len:255 (+) Transcript_44369:390-1154(+)
MKYCEGGASGTHGAPELSSGESRAASWIKEDETGVESNASHHAEFPMNIVFALDAEDRRAYGGASEKDLFDGHVHYTSSWSRDAVFFLLNNNVLLSLFFAHKNHPFTKKMRWMVQFCALSLTFLFSTFGLLLPRGIRAVWRLVVAPLLLLMWNIYIGILAQCPCLFSGFLSDNFRSRVSKIGRILLYIAVSTSIIFALLGRFFLSIAPDQRKGDSWMIDFVETQLSSLLWSIPTDLLIYSFLRRLQSPIHPSPV